MVSRRSTCRPAATRASLNCALLVAVASDPKAVAARWLVAAEPAQKGGRQFGVGPELAHRRERIGVESIQVTAVAKPCDITREALKIFVHRVGRPAPIEVFGEQFSSQCPRLFVSSMHKAVELDHLHVRGQLHRPQ